MGIAAVELRDFSFAYEAGAPVLEHVCATVFEGAFSLVCGGTGSGKTTLLKNLVPAIAPVGQRSGSALLFGEPLAESEPLAVGFVGQDPRAGAVCDTVESELAFGLENVGAEPSVMRRRIAEVAHFFGIEPLMREKMSSLSAGQVQQVELASALALRPRLLVLDEPAAQLDPVAQKGFLHLLFRVNRELGITVVMATHAPEKAADYATACLEVESGGVVARDPGKLPRHGQKLRIPQAHRASGGPAVSLRDVYVRYGRRERWVLEGFDLKVFEGHAHALVGGNGCGKSTALKTIAGALSSERGKVRNALAKSQAYLPQDPKELLVCDTVDEELREWQAACGYPESDIHRLLEQLGIGALGARHPFDLSGGQQQLVALAKLLLTHPRLLLLDEPTKGLDAQMKCQVLALLNQARDAGCTIVFSTHDLAFAALFADEVSLLFDGGVAACEPAARFFENNLFYLPEPDAFTDMVASFREARGGGEDGE